jgi:hypothetical protein
MMHAKCMKSVKIDAGFSHLMANLLKPFVSYAKNLSTLLLLTLLNLSYSKNSTLDRSFHRLYEVLGRLSPLIFQES